MNIALLADIHSNLEALTACLEHAAAHGAESYAFIGDLVGYGADPVAVLDRLQTEVARGAVAVQGNHDAAVAGQGSEAMNDTAEAAIAWTRAQLNEAQRGFLANLPLSVRDDKLLFVHASADAPEKWIYVHDALCAAHSMAATDARFIFSGHVHEPMLYYIGAGGRPLPFQPMPGTSIPVGPHRKWLAIVGSCGQPRDGNTAACYAMIDTTRWLLTFFRVPYDYAAAAAKIRAAGLPERLALRLEQGE